MNPTRLLLLIILTTAAMVVADRALGIPVVHRVAR